MSNPDDPDIAVIMPVSGWRAVHQLMSKSHGQWDAITEVIKAWELAYRAGVALIEAEIPIVERTESGEL